MDVVTIETPSLGDRSYVLTDGTVAVVVDPQRDLDRVLEVVDGRAVEVTHVLETHVHNDYVSGGFELARRTGARYVLNAAEELFFDFAGADDGDVFATGALRIRVLHTPGHTPTHLAYAVAAADDDAPGVVLTGGSLLYGSVGRTDLVARSRTAELSRLQRASAHRLAAELGDDVTVLPTHGFGSFCSSAAPEATAESSPADDGDDAVVVSTIGEQRRTNLAFTIPDEDEFVATLLGGLDAYPRYYVHMAPRNRVGADPVDLSPAIEARPGELARRIAAGEWVVDLRTRTAYAHDHVSGTVNAGIGTSFVTYLAWLLPWGMPVTLVGDTADEVAEAQRQLVRVGVDRPAAQAVGGIDVYGRGLERGRYGVADFAELARVIADGGRPHVLDVRRRDERERGSVAGSQHLPLHELTRRMDEIPDDRDVWIHCAGGFRASIAASLLARGGRTPVLVDDDDTRLFELGFELVTGSDA